MALEKQKKNRRWGEDNFANKLEISQPIAHFACLCGMRYPQPQWFLQLHVMFHIIWRLFFGGVEILVIFVIISNVVFLIQKASTEIAVFCECTGSAVYLICGAAKALFFYQKQELLGAIMSKLHSVAEELDENPVGNSGYIPRHTRRIKFIKTYCSGKFYLLPVALFGVCVNPLIPALINPSADNPTPMLGWIPFNLADRAQYTMVTLSQYLTYTTLVLRDVFADMTILFILASINIQFQFMRELLLNIIDGNWENRNMLFRWWVRQHTEILSILDDFKAITGPSLFVTYGSVTILFFLAMLRITEDTDFDVAQQATIIALTCSNLFHLYVISVLGDQVAYNSSILSDPIESPKLTDFGRRERKAILLISLRCTRPSRILFGDNRALSAHSFGEIVFRMLGYFNTVHQLRH